MNQLYPLLFCPGLLTKVWGGHHLEDMKNIERNTLPQGESWEISAVKNHESIVSNGPLAGRNLADITIEFGADLLGGMVFRMFGTSFPLLIKFIDAEQDLSIQVHPNNHLAYMRHKCFGKTEMWYVLEARPGACIIAGFNQQISKYEYNKRVEDGSIAEVLKHHTISKGDVFYIPAGRVHAIGSGCLVAEIQQSSDITYRIFDYNRLDLNGKKRMLHTELAVDAIDFSVQNDYQTHYAHKTNKPVSISESQYFTTKLLEITRDFHRKLYKYDSFIAYICLEGNCLIHVRSTASGEKCAVNDIKLRQGYSCLIPAIVADYDIIPENTSARLLEVYIDNKNFNK